MSSIIFAKKVHSARTGYSLLTYQAITKKWNTSFPSLHKKKKKKKTKISFVILQREKKLNKLNRSEKVPSLNYHSHVLVYEL